MKVYNTTKRYCPHEIVTKINSVKIYRETKDISLEIQTDCGGEFTHIAKTKRVHPFDVFCKRYHIRHHVFRPRTPWHNGKVERSHINDQERFYNHLSFYSFEDLQTKMKL